MIFADYDKFEHYIPTAVGSDISELKTYLNEAEVWMKDNVLGAELYAYMNANTDAPERATCERAICLKAYKEAIPFVDLIQTPNGFAVVRNANQAPASKERVDALVKQTVRRSSESVDSLLFAILYLHPVLHAEWIKDSISKVLTEAVFFTARELRQYTGAKDATRDDLNTMYAELLTMRAYCGRYFSADYLDALFEHLRSNQLTDSDQNVLNALRSIVGLKLQKKDYYRTVENTVNYMMSHLAEFPEFEASPEYRIKVGTKYENKRRHSTFFFGG